jgi:nitrogen fixation-related uncharacterized protein
VNVAAVVLVAVSVVLTAVVVVGLFIWAAVKDGQEDKATQARLGNWLRPLGSINAPS